MQWFNDLKTITKLRAAFGILAFLIAAVGLVGISGLKSMDSMLEKIYEDQALAGRYLKEASGDIRNIARFMRNAIAATGDETDKINKEIANINKADQSVRENLARLKPMLSSTETKDTFAALESEYAGWKATVDKIMALAVAQKDEETKPLVEEARTHGDKMEVTLTQFVQQKNQDSESLKKEAAALYARLQTGLVAMALVGVLLGAVAGYFIARRIKTSIEKVLQLVSAASTGDLTVRVDFQSQDDMGVMGRALNGFFAQLHASIGQVAESSESLALASRQLSAASEQMSAGSQQQASSLEETAASLEEITGTVKQNADNAKQANQLAMGSREVAERGGQVVTSAVEAMDEINRASKKIADIITTIDEIAFQTNLLALNAAVEAARAGEQGRGFAVVAAEVRNLAQRSATAAKEIKDLIVDSVAKVASGSQLVNRSGETLGEIVTSVKRVTDIIGEIAAASGEQSSGIDQVNKAVTQMDQVVQSNAAQTEELTSTARSLRTQAQQLQQLVAKFTLKDAVSRPQTIQPQAIRVAAPAPVAAASYDRKPSRAARYA
ncbi:MAG TPA: methyl-accepting chemotaxis protein, partial [Candidatus Binatia bacterium]|nr:methyl-accepting chemotaxis protein [Candidatus Binatia bacterium]